MFSRMKSVSIYLLAIWIIITVEYLILIYTNNALSVSGYRLEEEERKKHVLMLENELLKNQIASESSLRVIEQKALDSGFVDKQVIEYYK